jgi:hypothetical protein
MYGLIHSALRDMVINDHGVAVWNSVLESADVEPDVFLSMRQYDDATTLALIGSSAANTNMDVDRFLESFGFFWLTVFAPTDYGALLNLAGENPFEFLRNLNRLHERISTSFIDFRPPVFGVKDLGDDCIEVQYSSSRKGLTPFVAGILRGLSTMFDMTLRIEMKSSEQMPSGEKSVFEITKVDSCAVTHDGK